VFPNVIPLIGTSLWLLAGLTSMLLAAGSVGIEFELGTVQAAIGRGIPRWLYVLGKGTILLGAAAVNVLAGWLCGGLGAAFSHIVQVGTSGLGNGVIIMVTSGLLAVVVAVLSAAAYIGVTQVVSVLMRSPAFAMFGGLGLFVVDFFAGGFMPIPGWEEKGLGTFSVLGNTNLLLNQLAFAMGADWSAPMGSAARPGTAVLVLGCYAVGGAVLACVLFQRQDLGGKS
jgi:ABC-type transport system involved in multi-copper enzyme maturation permease subunit